MRATDMRRRLSASRREGDAAPTTAASASAAGSLRALRRACLTPPRFFAAGTGSATSSRSCWAAVRSAAASSSCGGTGGTLVLGGGPLSSLPRPRPRALRPPRPPARPPRPPLPSAPPPPRPPPPPDTEGAHSTVGAGRAHASRAARRSSSSTWMATLSAGRVAGLLGFGLRVGTALRFVAGGWVCDALLQRSFLGGDFGVGMSPVCAHHGSEWWGSIPARSGGRPCESGGTRTLRLERWDVHPWQQRLRKRVFKVHLRWWRPHSAES